jgi:LacI family transcriptional regulator
MRGEHLARKPTIDDIARLAGVSKTTVSRVLNARADVDTATRERVLRVIEEQNYVPSFTASGLAGGRSRLIGMLVPAWSWPLIPEIMRGIVEVVKQTPYELVLYSINDEDLVRDRSEVINRLLAAQLTAGLLAIYPEQVSQQLTHLYAQGFPVVIIDDQRVQTTPSVGADNFGGAYAAVSHLVELGHRRIAHVQGPTAYLASQDRLRGYRQALLDAGIEPDAALVLMGDFMPPSGRSCAARLFELPVKQRPSAIFAATDQMAYGVLAAAEDAGLNVPRDVALVGFDDDAPSMHTHPPLTTVRQPYLEMGQRGIELLLSLLDQSGASLAGVGGWPPVRARSNAKREADAAGASPVHIQLPTSLVVRASCGADYAISLPTKSDTATA